MNSVTTQKRRLSLPMKFNLLTISLIVLTSVGIAVFVVRTEMVNNYQGLLTHGRSVVSMIVQNSEYGIYTEDNKSLQQIVESIEADPAIAYISIINRDRHTLVRKQKDPEVNIPMSLGSNEFSPSNGIIFKEFTCRSNGRSYIDIVAPVLSASPIDPVEMLEMGEKISHPKIIGYIQLGLTQEKLREHLRQFLLSTVIFISVFTMFGVVLTVFIIRKIVSPVRKLSSAVEDISEGKLNHNIDITTNDEISDLSRAFNNMLGKLRDYRNEVERRSAELLATNQMMQLEIAERGAAEEALAAEKERLAVTLRSIGDGVITADTKGNIILINKAAEDLTGWCYTESQGKVLSDVFQTLQPGPALDIAKIVQRVLESKGTIDLGNNVTLISKNGAQRIVDVRCAPIRHKTESIIGVIIVFRDVTEQKKTEEEIMQNKLDSIGVLAGGIAHDFNNLLTAILGNISIAKMKIRNEGAIEKTIERLNEAEKASLRARDLTQQLLTFSKGTPVKKIFDIKELIRDSSRFATRGSNVKYEFRISEDLSAAEVDAGQISQVINNIVLNAVQSMPEGGTIRVDAENITSSDEDALSLAEGKYIKISIHDQGIGISEKHLKKIFDPYFTTKHHGSGLGLASSYSIIKKHNGYIRVESKTGVGTTFYVYLPATESKPKESQSSDINHVKGNEKVLIMDDEEIIRNCLSDMLQDLGYDVICTKDGSEAIKSYVKAKESGTPFDVVIMDLTVPGGMGGKDAIKKLSEIDRNIKAIVSSGYSNDPVMSNFKEYGFRAVLAKPFNARELNEAMRKAS